MRETGVAVGSIRQEVQGRSMVERRGESMVVSVGTVVKIPTVTKQADQPKNPSYELTGVVIWQHPKSKGVKVATQAGIVGLNVKEGEKTKAAVLKNFTVVGEHVTLHPRLEEIRQEVLSGNYNAAEAPIHSPFKLHWEIHKKSPLKRSAYCKCKNGCTKRCGCHQNKRPCRSGCSCYKYGYSCQNKTDYCQETQQEPPQQGL